MKRKLCLAALACLLLTVSHVMAGTQVPTDSSVKADMKTQADTLNKKIEQINKEKTALSKQVDTLKQKDSLQSKAVGVSFSNALKIAKEKPEVLYNKPFKKYWYISVITFIFLGYFLYKAFWFAKNSALCKDDSYYKDDSGNIILKPFEYRTYSYSRVQLFWWTVIVITCYSIFYALYGVLLPLNPSVIILIGSGLAVFIFGKTIDNSQIESNLKGNAEPTRHQDLYKSTGLLTDILSDDNGISIHRLQAVAFNVIYGIGFIGFFVMSINADPQQYPLMEFEEWQLALLGVSAAGYLGLKTNENNDASKLSRVAEAKKDLNPPGDNSPDHGGTTKPDAKNGNATGEPGTIVRDTKNYQ